VPRHQQPIGGCQKSFFIIFKFNKMDLSLQDSKGIFIFCPPSTFTSPSVAATTSRKEGSILKKESSECCYILKKAKKNRTKLLPLHAEAKNDKNDLMPSGPMRDLL